MILAILFWAVIGSGSLVLAAVVGAFRPDTVSGPQRLERQEPIVPLWMIGMAGMLVWVLVQQAFLVAADSQATSQPTTQAANIDSPTVTIVSGLFAIAVLVGGNIFFRPRGLSRLGFDLKSLSRSGVIAAIGAAIIVPLTCIAAILTNQMWQFLDYENPGVHPLLRAIKEHPSFGMWIGVAFSAIIIAPIMEELLFRGHLQTAILYTIARHGDMVAARWIAIGITSLLFTMVHGELWLMPPIFFLSICLGYIYERTANLWVPMLVHAAFNAVQVLYFFWAVHHPN